MQGRHSWKIIIFIIYLIFGLYLLNFSFNIISLPDFGGWIVTISGILLILASIKQLWPHHYGAYSYNSGHY